VSIGAPTLGVEVENTDVDDRSDLAQFFDLADDQRVRNQQVRGSNPRASSLLFTNCANIARGRRRPCNLGCTL